MGKRKREEEARLQELSAKVDRWLKGYQKSSLLILAIGIVGLLNAIMEVAGFLSNALGNLGIAYFLHGLLQNSSLEEGWANAIYLVICFMLVGLFAFFSVFAAKGNAYAMYGGIAAYTLDFVYLLVDGFLHGFEKTYGMLILHGVFLLGLGVMVFYYYMADHYWRLYQAAEKQS